jgi:hypothetical protein
MARRVRPVSRLGVLGGALVLLAVLAGVAALAEALRHPPTVAPVELPEEDGDPRDEVVCPAPPDPEGAPPRVSSNDLYECPHVYDGRAVRYEGEVVGALLRRAEGTWTQLNDDVYAGDLGPLPAHREFRGGNAGVGVLLPHALARGVEWVGGPNARGDVLTVVGTFHLSDPASREVAVIRATEGHVARAGSPIEHAPLSDRRFAGLVLAAAAGIMLLVARYAARSS